MDIICILSDNKDIGLLLETGFANMGFRKIQTYMDRFTNNLSNYPGNTISITRAKIDELEEKDKLINRFKIGAVEFAISKPYGSTKYVISTDEDTLVKFIDTYGQQVKCLLVDKDIKSLNENTINKLKTTKVATSKSSENISDILVKIIK